MVKTLADCLMGKVKAAKVLHRSAGGEWVDTGNMVAIKILLKSCIRNKTTRDGRRIQENPSQEILAMKFLHGHPHVLQLQDLMSDHEHVFVVLEFAAGKHRQR